MNRSKREIERFHFATIGSTNDWAKEHAEQFNRNGFTVITADRQTAGRGQFERRWISSKHSNLYVTFVFFLQGYPAFLTELPQLLARSVLEVLEYWGFHATLKWPNDLMIQEKKVGGILTETMQMEDGFLCIIIGLGLNLNLSAEEIVGIDQPATSLKVEGGKDLEWRELLSQIELLFFRRVEDLKKV